MKSILVTGGFGFLGGHLIDTLLEHYPNAEITVVDDLSSNAVNPVLFSHGKPITHINTDIENYVNAIHEDEEFAEIYHLASIVGPAGVLPHQGRIVKSIVDDTYAILALAKRTGAKLLFVSTSEVYGGGQDGYCSEEMPPIIPVEASVRLEYAIGKLASEIAILEHAKAKTLEAVIVRPFNIAGARQSGVGGFVLPRFLKAAQDGKPLTVFGSGSQSRALTEVRDVAEGLYLAMLRGKSGEIYNIGNEQNKCTIGELADRVLALYPSDSTIEYIDPVLVFGNTYVEANDKYPNSKKAREQLGWSPQYDLEDIIKSAINDRTNK
jgi:UDP-glucose 4-epimerase